MKHFVHDVLNVFLSHVEEVLFTTMPLPYGQKNEKTVSYSVTQSILFIQ